MINSLINNNINEFKEEIDKVLNQLVAQKLEEVKKYVVDAMFEEFEEFDDLDEAANVIRMGRTKLIRRRIRSSGGRIKVQRNIRRSAVKGFTLRGGKMKRITAMQKVKMKRAQKRGARKRRMHKQQILRRRMLSIRRRKSLGIR